ncbi:serine carboxypeptidase-like 3-like protein [Corchorus olitorius]|uniref:Serine carboxypeptidase-like 3-like protein n=1 Tax=Corchorus olitorius TaxID=93759 RepID=A0A1R3ITW3_9ROSI|nr:serine carboxypeptidase-like 3-like protein [Corchorus olitorius]
MAVDPVLDLMALKFCLSFTNLPCFCHFRYLLLGWPCLLLGILLMWPSGTLMMPIIKCHVDPPFHLNFAQMPTSTSFAKLDQGVAAISLLLYWNGHPSSSPAANL